MSDPTVSQKQRTCSFYANASEDLGRTLGVPAGRLPIISYGKEKPAVDGHNEAPWAKNRRDEFVILK